MIAEMDTFGFPTEPSNFYVFAAPEAADTNECYNKIVKENKTMK